MSLNQPHKQAANLGGITLNMIIVSQKIYDRFWLAEELSDDHWLNVNKDTKAEVSIGFANDKRSD